MTRKTDGRSRSWMGSVALIVGVVAVGAAAMAENRSGTRGVTSQSPLLANNENEAAGRMSAPSRRPNVVVITVDDMRADDLAYMPRTRRLLGQLSLTQFVSNHPLCCPARAELLTGQLAQRNGVRQNPGPQWGGYAALRGKNNTMPHWFRGAGYRTALVGKFLNGWCPTTEERPRGWTDFKPLVENAYSAFNYSYYDNTRTRPAPPGVHTNDFVTGETLARMSAYEASDRAPFLIWSSYVAPHAMTRFGGAFVAPIPAVRHQGVMEGVVPLSMSKPSYQDPSSRQYARALAGDPAGCTPERQAAGSEITIEDLNQARLESLQSVDEGVGRMMRKLQRLGELRRSVVVFSSDNGFLMGEHGLLGKNSHYEESLRVPLLARGPGVAEGESVKGAMITDVAPSLAALARVKPERVMDGRGDLFAVDGGWEELLIQTSSDVDPWLWRGVRTDRWTYVVTLNGTLLFDRETDPYQMENLAGQRPDVEAQLGGALAGMTQ